MHTKRTNRGATLVETQHAQITYASNQKGVPLSLLRTASVAMASEHYVYAYVVERIQKSRHAYGSVYSFSYCTHIKHSHQEARLPQIIPAASRTEDFQTPSPLVGCLCAECELCPRCCSCSNLELIKLSQDADSGRCIAQIPPECGTSLAM